MSKVYSVEYTLKNTNGDVVDTNVNGAPLEFISGKQQMIPGFEKAVIGMEVNEEKEVTVAPSEGYGEYDETLVQSLPKEQFDGIELEKGITLYGQGPDGQTVSVVVKDFNDTEVTIDYNHPLAGEDLIFTIKLLDVRDATQEELSAGCVGGACCSTSSHSHEGDSCGCGTGCGCH